MRLNPSGLLIAFFWYTEASYSQNLDQLMHGVVFDPELPLFGMGRTAGNPALF